MATAVVCGDAVVHGCVHVSSFTVLQYYAAGAIKIKMLKRYYELGPDDPPYAAKFYDCCGAEDPEAPGCTSNFHVSYDDD
ncbi:hypothetical protein EZV62_024596 [Acer yangbiense]|uniref:Uncharacterized protein n=1 Tax=Acer yangbiense TaxID=1000413 RepID=A0A5C7GVV6_9ROSI|nr:hypothetical protein EZV62_024596 [Acer yangbiense]